jgi:hypothetical protein
VTGALDALIIAGVGDMDKLCLGELGPATVSNVGRFGFVPLEKAPPAVGASFGRITSFLPGVTDVPKPPSHSPMSSKWWLTRCGIPAEVRRTPLTDSAKALALRGEVDPPLSSSLLEGDVIVREAVCLRVVGGETEACR